MVGGGPDAFIGAVHRAAARLDGHWVLVAGAFSSDPERSRRHGASLDLDPARAYGSWADLLKTEATFPVSERIDAVVVVTPNHLTFRWPAPLSRPAST